MVAFIVLFSGCSATDPSEQDRIVTYRVTGTITSSDEFEDLESITVAMGERTALTNDAGVYRFDSVANGSYIVAPIKAGRVFTPPSITARVDNSDGIGNDFYMTNPSAVPDDSVQMVLIPAGTFSRGVDTQYSNMLPLAAPKHHVTITRSFWMGIHEVTQVQWDRNMLIDNSKVKGLTLPVHNVSWYDALRFCNELSDKHGYERVYENVGLNVWINDNANGYRLPTEAEWEYAAAAGDTSIWYGVPDVPADATDEQLTGLLQAQTRHAWNEVNSSNGGARRPQRVGQLEPNAWGLFDMIGNVQEMTIDSYRAYRKQSQVDPIEFMVTSKKIVRGGGFEADSQDDRVGALSLRGRVDEYTHGSYKTGFRVIRYDR